MALQTENGTVIRHVRRPRRSVEQDVGGAAASRAYLLLGISQDKREDAARALRAMPGVVHVDGVLGPPDLVVVTEASSFDALVRQSIAALAAVEDYTDSVRCFGPRG